MKIKRIKGNNAQTIILDVKNTDSKKIHSSHQSLLDTNSLKDIKVQEFKLLEERKNSQTNRTQTRQTSAGCKQSLQTIDQLQNVATVRNTESNTNRKQSSSKIMVNCVSHKDPLETKHHSRSRQKTYSEVFETNRRLSKATIEAAAKEDHLKLESNSQPEHQPLDTTQTTQLNCSIDCQSKRRQGILNFKSAVSILETNLHSVISNKRSVCNQKGQLIRQRKPASKLSKTALNNTIDNSLNSMTLKGGAGSLLQSKSPNRQSIERCSLFSQTSRETKFESFFTKNLFRKDLNIDTPSAKNNTNKENLHPNLGTNHKCRENTTEPSPLEKTYNNLFQKSRQALRHVLSSSNDDKLFIEGLDPAQDLHQASLRCSNSFECKRHHKIYKLDADNVSLEELELFRKIRPLLEGSHFYKKFTSSSIRQQSFDPRLCYQKPPEQCGFGIRFLRLNINRKCIEVLTVQKASVERATCISNILKVCTTRSEQLRREGAKNIELVPFELHAKDGSIELISLTASDFRTWTTGLQTLQTRTKEVCKIAAKIRCVCI